jgi:hypothetical protein
MFLNARISVLLCFALLLVPLLGLSGCGKDKVRTALKAEDDVATALTGIATVVKQAQDEGLLSIQQVDEIKAPLREIADANDVAIQIAREQIGKEPSPAARQRLFAALALATDAIKRLNVAGTLHIKSAAMQTAFVGFITTLETAIAAVSFQLNGADAPKKASK